MLIALAGPMGSGKSTVSRALAEKLNAKILGFGDYVRVCARELGLDPDDRTELQDLGQRLVVNDPVAFVRNAIQWAGYQHGKRIVLDGVRHEIVWDAIPSAIGIENAERVLLIYLDVPADERTDRLRARGISDDAIVSFNAHPSESDLKQRLSPKADILLDSRQPLPILVATVLRSLESK
jgi:dephospho-CoA kinase